MLKAKIPKRASNLWSTILFLTRALEYYLQFNYRWYFDFAYSVGVSTNALKR